MLFYILKSTAILTILILFYKLFLERENMHTFKRFYLLGALALAYVIPFISFVEYIEIPLVAQTAELAYNPKPVMPDAYHEQDLMTYLPIGLWSVYFIGLMLFGYKFIKNLAEIITRIRRNPKLRVNLITNVLLSQNVAPHTFFNYIFLNRKKFEAKQIPHEVLLHEETHAIQKHSLDVLIIELLQVFFWFNPLLYFIKKDIKLNHEYLADREVLTKGVPPALYQNILLRFSSDPHNSHSAEMANAINYSSIKKRFTVMKTKTSKKSIVLRSIALLPILALLLFGFSERKRIEVESIVEPNIPSIEQNLPVEKIDIRITNNEVLYLQNKDIVTLNSLKSHLLKLNTQLSKAQRSQNVRAEILANPEVPTDLLEAIEAILVDYGVAQVNIIGPEEYMDQNLGTIEQKGATNTQIKTYNTLAKQYNSFSIEERKIPPSDLEILETVYRKMNEDQREKSQPFPECPRQEGATKKQIKEYNALAKKYNRQLSDAKEIRIQKSDVERLEHLHGLMTHEQRENAEPFPDFPEPPEPIDAPIPPKAPQSPRVIKGKKSENPPAPPAPSSPLRHQEVEVVNVIDEIIANQDPYDGLNTIHSVPSSKKNSIYPPPVPPTPVSPLDHAIEMAKQGALFYYGKKKITSDEAIDLLKRNSNLSMDVSKKNNNPPVVKISRFLD